MASEREPGRARSGRTCACGEFVSRDGPSDARGNEWRRIPRASGGTNTTTGSSRQQRHHHLHPRAETSEPLEPNPTPRPSSDPTPRLSPALPAFVRFGSTVRPRLTHLIPVDLICPDPDPLPPPRLRPLQLPAWAGPSRFYPDSRGRGSGATAADPLPPRAHAGSQGNTRRRRGGLLRSREKPIERNRWRETQGGKQVFRRRQLRFPGSGLAAARPLHPRWAVDRWRGGIP
jgi:hypothetical protein